jgi:hypothetical protein
VHRDLIVSCCQILKLDVQRMDDLMARIVQMILEARLRFALKKSSYSIDSSLMSVGLSLLQISRNGPSTAPPLRQTVTSWFVRSSLIASVLVDVRLQKNVEAGY